MSKALRLQTPAAIVADMSFEDVLRRLAILSPSDAGALEILARDALARRWPQTPRQPLRRE